MCSGKDEKPSFSYDSFTSCNNCLERKLILWDMNVLSRKPQLEGRRGWWRKSYTSQSLFGNSDILRRNIYTNDLSCVISLLRERLIRLVLIGFAILIFLI